MSETLPPARHRGHHMPRSTPPIPGNGEAAMRAAKATTEPDPKPLGGQGPILVRTSAAVGENQ